MIKLTHVSPLVTKISLNQVTVSKDSFDALIKHINILTDTVNELIDHGKVSDENIKKLAKSIEIIGG